MTRWSLQMTVTRRAHRTSRAACRILAVAFIVAMAPGEARGGDDPASLFRNT